MSGVCNTGLLNNLIVFLPAKFLSKTLREAPHVAIKNERPVEKGSRTIGIPGNVAFGNRFVIQLFLNRGL